MTETRPRNRNPRSDREPHSWSSAFAERVENKRNPTRPMGFCSGEDD